MVLLSMKKKVLYTLGDGVSLLEIIFRLKVEADCKDYCKPLS